ncbi:MAG: Uma2 family endonuclease [Calothrix sp. MO_192.B10]|nr:Uma2 family endonuclease [Calothrix sp. MO_192.B10]
MATTLTSPVEKVQLSGISWQTYEALLSELSSHRRLRLTYNQGNLEIMVPSPEHERYKEVIGRFVETLAEELEIRIEPLGSTTFKRLGTSGAEPDKCFYVKNIDEIKGKKRFQPNEEPAPDLVVEIDITSSSEQRLAVYQDLGVPEVWVYNGKSFQIMQLQSGGYGVVHESSIFPNLPLDEIDNFLEKVGDVDYLELVKSFRNWVRNQIS